MRKSIVVPLASFLVSIAGVASASTSAVRSEMETRLKELYPSTRITAVHQSEVAGLFEVTMGKNVAFSDASGRYFVFGHLFDMREQKDLTAQRLSDINRIDFAQLPLQDAIKTVRGDGSRKLAVFSDRIVPIAKGWKVELAKLDNVSIFYLPVSPGWTASRSQRESGASLVCIQSCQGMVGTDGHWQGCRESQVRYTD